MLSSGGLRRRVRWHGAELPLAAEALGADGVPAGAVRVPIARDVLLAGLQRIVRSVVGQVEEERLAGRVGLVQEPERVIGERIRLVEGLALEVHLLREQFLAVEEEGPVPLSVPCAVRAFEVGCEAVKGQRIVERAAFEQEVRRPVPEVFLPDHDRVVPRAPQEFGQGLRVRGVAFLRDQPRVDGGPRGLALGHVVEAGETHALGGEAVDVGRADLRSVRADVCVAQVVGEDEDDVGWPGVGEGGREQDAAEGEPRALSQALWCDVPGPPVCHPDGTMHESRAGRHKRAVSSPGCSPLTESVSSTSAPALPRPGARGCWPTSVRRSWR